MNIFKSSIFKNICGDALALGPGSIVLTIKSVRTEAIETHDGKKENKPVMYFVETDKGLILNRTNAKTLAKLFSSETDSWTGHKIELYSEKVKAFGEVHNAIRLRQPEAAPAPAPAAEPQATITPLELFTPPAPEPAPIGENYYSVEN